MNYLNTPLDEQETYINIDYKNKSIKIYTNVSAISKRVEKRIGSGKQETFKKQICSELWEIPFEEKTKITKVLSRPLLIGNR